MVFLSAAGADWLISHTLPDPCLYIPNRIPPFFPILTGVHLDLSKWPSWVRNTARLPLELFSNAPKLVKAPFDACKGLDVKKIIPLWQQFRDLSIEDCPWEDIRPMLLAYVACQHLCLRCCKPFKSICEFHSMLEDQSGDLWKPGTRIPKYLPQLEALDLVLVRNECGASSYNLLHRFIQAHCEHRISTNSFSFSQLNVECGTDIGKNEDVYALYEYLLE
ncbi:hypothetical protein FISHEDRAFT_74880 [Fistulina hepatica ATCC 64428]|uniref:Uncharacterized protein n=1 Tax=Fistulina hepatica ATCC 64428 TaxID=1128425 RepID=A0A0D7A877_9AGAR|nr:hypothetical protein FISHEDRAFT_74880 [Fistulina hepatica ATCC 64428]